MPAFTETRVFAFNQTTLKGLNLKLPPPFSDWGPNNNEWTWPAMIDYAARIKNADFDEGFRFQGGWDEEVCVIVVLPKLTQLSLG